MKLAVLVLLAVHGLWRPEIPPNCYWTQIEAFRHRDGAHPAVVVIHGHYCVVPGD